MPSLLGYVEKKGALPVCLTFSLAALMAFYDGTEMRDGRLVGHRGDEEYMISDDRAVLEFFSENAAKPVEELVAACLSKEGFWGQKLTEVAGLEAAVAIYLKDIKENGMRAALCRIFLKFMKMTM